MSGTKSVLICKLLRTGTMQLLLLSKYILAGACFIPLSVIATPPLASFQQYNPCFHQPCKNTYGSVT